MSVDTPIFLEYDMHTGNLSMNNIVHLEKDAFHTNNTIPNDFLFTLPSLAKLRADIDPMQSGEDFQKEQLKQGGSFQLQKQQLEDRIEKNRTMQYLLSTFDLQLNESYSKESV